MPGSRWLEAAMHGFEALLGGQSGNVRLLWQAQGRLSLRWYVTHLVCSDSPCTGAFPAAGDGAAPMMPRQPEGWLPYYPPRFVRDLAGTDAVTGEAASIERGYIPHRVDLEKVRVLDARAARCDQDLGLCEQRVASIAAPSDFWDGSAGRILLIGLGFLAGMGVTAGLAVVVE